MNKRLREWAKFMESHLCLAEGYITASLEFDGLITKVLNVPTGKFTVSHDVFNSKDMSIDGRSYFLEGFGLLEIVGTDEYGVILEYYNHCGDVK